MYKNLNMSHIIVLPLILMFDKLNEYKIVKNNINKYVDNNNNNGYEYLLID